MLEESPINSSCYGLVSGPRRVRKMRIATRSATKKWRVTSSIFFLSSIDPSNPIEVPVHDRSIASASSSTPTQPCYLAAIRFVFGDAHCIPRTSMMSQQDLNVVMATDYWRKQHGWFVHFDSLQGLTLVQRDCMWPIKWCNLITIAQSLDPRPSARHHHRFSGAVSTS